MNRSILLLLLFCATAGSAHGQNISRLERNRTIERRLDSAQKHTYEITLGADQFVFGDADQKSVDVVVTVYKPDGTVVGEFDGPARGPEQFRFETATAGTFRIVVAPFQKDTGSYAITLRQTEPVAKTAEGKARQWMAQYKRDDAPGGVVAVIERGKVTFAETYGLAELAHGVPITTRTRFNIASISKHFTAFAILMLADQGKLRLDDNISTYFPQIPDFGRTVTLRHLLTHTGGLREIFGTFGFLGYRDNNNLAQTDALRIATRQTELQFEPGSEYLYNNTGYILLADIIAQVTGTPFPEWMKKNVFEPLGMTHTTIMTDPGKVIPDAALSYGMDASGQYLLRFDNSDVRGSTGIYTTIEDLAKWMGNFHKSTIGAPDIVSRMTVPPVLTGGDTSDYAYGLAVGTHRGLRRYDHSGSTAAFNSMLLYYPSIDAGVVVISNGGRMNPFGTAPRIAEIFFEKQMTPKQSAPAAVAGAQSDPPTARPVASRSIDPALLDAYAGRYDLTGARLTITYRREGDHLLADASGQSRRNLIPVTDSTFTYEGIDATVTFHRDANGTVNRATHTQGGELPLRRMQEFAPTAAELGIYAGRYLCPELDVIYTITVEKDSLVVRHPLIEDVTLGPKEPDVFSSRSWFFTDAVFLRNEKGAVSGIRVSNGRTRNMIFTKQQ